MIDLIGILNSLDPHGCGFLHLIVDAAAWLGGPVVGLWFFLKGKFASKIKKEYEMKQTVEKRTCKKCRRQFEFSTADAGPWEHYCYKCERELDKADGVEGEKKEEACVS